MATPTHWMLFVVPSEHVATARALTQQYSDTGDAGMTFLTKLNASGDAADPITHYASGSHVGPEVMGLLATLKAALTGSDYYPPAPTAERDLAGAWAWLAGLGLRVVQHEPPSSPPS